LMAFGQTSFMMSVLKYHLKLKLGLAI